MPSNEPSSLRDEPARSRFELTRDGQLAGFIDYREHGEVLDLVHTEVQPAYEGQGLGAQLAGFALEQARQRGRRVRPSCTFIAAYLRRHPEHADLVAS